MKLEYIIYFILIVTILLIVIYSILALNIMEPFISSIIVFKNNIYDKIYEIIYINLENEPKRKKRIEKYIKKYFPDKKFRRFNAINKESIHNEENIHVWKNKVKDYRHGNGDLSFKFSGVIGCYMSHYNVMKYINKKYKQKYFTENKIPLILEDDCKFGIRTIKFLKSTKFNINIPEDWKILKPIRDVLHEEDKINDVFYHCYRNQDDQDCRCYFGGEFLIVNPSHVNEILNILDKYNKVYDIDVIYRKMVPNIYCFKNGYIFTDNYNSSERAPEILAQIKVN